MSDDPIDQMIENNPDYAKAQIKPNEDLDVLDEAGIGYNPTSQYLDLTKEEKRRTTALMLATNAYKELIIRDALYLEKVADLARRGDLGPREHGAPLIRPATIDAMVEAAFKFDCFIAGLGVVTGDLKTMLADETRGGAQTETEDSALDETQSSDI